MHFKKPEKVKYFRRPLHGMLGNAGKYNATYGMLYCIQHMQDKQRKGPRRGM